MRRFFAVLLAAGLAVLPGCGGTGRTVSIEGSTAMVLVAEALREGFAEREPGVAVNCSGTGSGAGVEAAVSGRCDIGLSSRALRDAELARGAQAHLIALDGVAVIVHPSNPVAGLAGTELARLFTGEVANWSELGGLDAPVAAYGREAGSGTRDAFEAAIGAAGRCIYTNEYSSTGDVVGNVAANPNAVGYASLAAISGSVAALEIDGVTCTTASVRAGSSRISRPFLLVTRAGAPLSPEAQAFLDYARSAGAAAVIGKAGAVSILSLEERENQNHERG